MDKHDVSFVPSAPWGGSVHVADLDGAVHWVDFGDPVATSRRSCSCTASVVHGTHDRLVSPAAADEVAQANPRWEYLLLGGVGHTPQMEVPGRFASEVLSWLAGDDVGGGAWSGTDGVGRVAEFHERAHDRGDA
jgi:pimeloyl-ACP methyl ester carboxylesterase